MRRKRKVSRSGEKVSAREREREREIQREKKRQGGRKEEREPFKLKRGANVCHRASTVVPQARVGGLSPPYEGTPLSVFVHA